MATIIKDMFGSDWESLPLANNLQFRALIEESRRSYREEGGISLEELQAELGLQAYPRDLKRKKNSRG